MVFILFIKHNQLDMHNVFTNFDLRLVETKTHIEVETNTDNSGQMAEQKYFLLTKLL